MIDDHALRIDQAVERLKADLAAWEMGGVCMSRGDDIRLLLSERAELLAAVERMRVALEGIAKSPTQWDDPEPWELRDIARAALTTGEGN